MGVNHDEQHIMCSKTNERKAVKKTGEAEFGAFYDDKTMFWASKINNSLQL